jgi:putative oxidoreductase
MFESPAFRDVWAPRLLSIVRILLGLLYLQHGLSKYFGFPAAAPQNFQVFSLLGLAGAIEIVGGLMLALGIYTRWVAFILSGEMAVAFFIVRNRLSTSLFPMVNGGQLEAVYSIFFFTFFLVGGGAWSLDQLRKARSA